MSGHRDIGVYVILFHGRKHGEELEDWGEDGPVFGPFAWAHQTYATDIHLGEMDGGDTVGDLNYLDDLVYYDGMFYGDMSITSEPDEEELSRLVPFDEVKARIPTRYFKHQGEHAESQFAGAGTVPPANRLLSSLELAARRYMEETIADTDAAQRAKAELSHMCGRAAASGLIGEIVGASADEANRLINHGHTGARVSLIHDELLLKMSRGGVATDLDRALFTAADNWLNAQKAEAKS